MASIIISPTSASFTSSGGNGSISLTVETANWHTTPQSGDIWMAQRKRTDGVWSSWVVFRIVGEKGDDGVSSPTMVYSGYYHVNPNNGQSDTSRKYYGNANLISVVYHGNQYYKAKPTAAAAYGSSDGTFVDSSSSPSSTYWESFGASFESIASGVVFATKAYLDNAVVRLLETTNLNSDGYIVAENNSMAMYDGNGSQKMLITGQDLPTLTAAVGTTFYIPTSSGDTTIAESSIGTTVLTGSKNLASLTISQPGNVVTIPNITITITRSGGQAALQDDPISATARILVDGTVISSASVNGRFTPMDTPGKTFTIPGRSFNLTTATSSSPHVISISVDAEGVNLRTVEMERVQGSVSYTTEQVQVGANGFRAAYSPTSYAEFSNGVYILRAGNYVLKVSSSGIQKSTDGGSNWSNV